MNVFNFSVTSNADLKYYFFQPCNTSSSLDVRATSRRQHAILGNESFKHTQTFMDPCKFNSNFMKVFLFKF